MAKNAPVKKSKRKLKRSVRRSVAAVLMITAIGVAAVPVPENLAAPDGDEVDTTPLIQYEEASKEGGDYEDNTYTQNAYSDVTEENFDVKNGENGANGKLHATEVIIRDTGGIYLTWQFIYQELTNTTGLLCKYNSRFAVDKVTLGLQPVEHYYVITADDFGNYFTNPASVNGSVSGGGIAADFAVDMDNLSDSHPLYPTKKITYDFAHYDPVTNDIYNMDERAIQFLKDYYGSTVEDYTRRFKEYNDGGKQGTEPVALTKGPSDLEGQARIDFFCEHNMVLKGTEYRLTPVTDYRLNKKGDPVYVAYGGKPEQLQGGIYDTIYEDDGGYIVTKDKHSITTIGDKAFFQVTNVGQIEISGQVSYIGDSAFEQSGISSLYIGNADMIGNRAFANCTALKAVTFGEHAGTSVIGAEAFRGSGINTRVSLPDTVVLVGHGAFSDCIDLNEVVFDVDSSTRGVLELKNYAFYNDKKLTLVEFGKSNVKRIGKACFAIQSPSGDLMTEFSFPTVQLSTLDEYVLANRRGLLTVNIPFYTGSIPESTFYNCFGLERAQFGADSASATFGTKLFYYVTNPAFCVYGPELFGSEPASPRKSTWDAERKDEQTIPYVYESGGKICYEAAYESGGTRYRYGAGNDGELISCALIPPVPSNGVVDIVIPSKIGNFDIKRIGNTCFSDKDLRGRIRSITIQNNSVSEIADAAFRDLPKLEKVRIGNSVTRIGDNAFAGCNILYNVYFATPSAGYDSLSFGNNAFVTTGSKLTFHGDIVKGYAPFDYAANPNNILKDAENKNAPDIHICYQSLWDSAVGTHLTVICDKNGVMTLVDYPKFSDLSEDNIRFDEELQDYCRDMENYYYYTVYDTGSNVEQLRKEYALIWDASQEPRKSSVDLGEGGVIEFHTDQDYANALEERYGPWINPNYCGDGKEAGYWTTYLTASASNSDGNDLIDLLFEPIVALAAGKNPTPYFDANPYNFMKNYESYLNDPLYDSLPDYKKVPDRVWNYINATRSIIVPDGVYSIDVNTYSNENAENYNMYIKDGRDPNSHSMYTSIKNGAQPGLFSGYYKDYDDGDSREKNANGNDYVRSIVLTSVKTLPDYAFDSCEQLERVELGAVEQIGVLPFRGCPNLTQLIGSEKYPAQNGILYEKQEGTPETYKIVECLLSRGKSGTGNENLEKASIAPDPDSLISSVTEIADSAFEGCDGITIVDLSTAEQLETIPLNCFNNCASLINVKLPRTVTKIRDGAFGGITSDTHPLSVTIPGREVDIADDAFLPKNNVTIYTYENSAAYRYGKRYENQGMRVETLEAYRVMFYDYDGTQIGTTQIVEKEAGGLATEPIEAEALKEKDHRPGYTFSGWETTGGKTLADKITEDMTIFIAQYMADGTMVNGKYVVEFLDGIDGRRLSGRFSNEEDGRYYIEAGTSFMDNGWEAPAYYTHDGYTFKEWSQNWTENTTITSNMTVIALYSATPTSGHSSNTSGNSSNTSKNSGNTGSNTSSRNSSSNSSADSSSSNESTSSTSSGSGSTAGKYTVTVVNGSGSGSYEVGTTVVIAANEPAPGTVFQKWTTESNGVTLASVSMTATTFTMPANNVTVTANYTAATSSGSNSNNGNNSSGSTRVDITKPGISNKDLATANVNGSSDNFIVKITETDEATRAVADALTNKYGSLDNILYYAMDISLYDSTGTVKISDTSGITVDITIPIPDALVAYGGNNMAGAVINGNQLENLNESFTTINGVPCIRFTATHFSPYTIYVDTGNLTEGMLDTTPKTGDPIHPKWFLSIGLACLSVILFMKKDKAVKVKTA